MAETPIELRRAALELLVLRDPADKAARVGELAALPVYADAGLALQEPAGLPGRPERPELVSPRWVKARGVASVEARAALLHALVHIEFNAINLALDAVWRFAGMPERYYRDWLEVAAEEALHFSLLAGHLAVLGHAYGDFPAHDGLWQMAEKTRDDPLARMALVPRTLEARGLDASPAIRAKLFDAGDARAAEILDVILRDEIGHVATGNRWYRYLCEQAGVESTVHYDTLVDRYDAPVLRGPFNLDARLSAGFTQAELLSLQQAAASGRGRLRSGAAPDAKSSPKA